ncbi:ATP-dependent 6-phosphofructokinase [Mycoplasma sp. SG1]|uniref:ATP-dependent 6-phosphofructokinase n=1 Tax=Mycoplasma sp. SG1 TaxID=2810348 RepID=UPI00202435F4|nr:ATP-dependent 6-phosphofructokinase [Mycoplasma sp. SG1]URM52956.1 6-phosphofructokinase [Mycoplasma sp. SG1]
MKQKKVAILTSGGDAPGMNTCLRAIVRTALKKNIIPYLVYDGYLGLVNNNIVEADYKSVGNILNKGGTVIGTARLPEFKEKAVRAKGIKNLQDRGIDYLICIGGDGTYMGASRLSDEGINCITIPATIDNNIASSEFTIGFWTALQTIIEAIDKLRDTSSSHHRCSIVEVMGQYSGYLTYIAGITTGAEVISTPDNKKNVDQFVEAIKHAKEDGKNHCLIVVTENMYDMKQLEIDITKKSKVITRATVLGHVQRGGSPCGFDRILATMFGYHAILAVLNNKSKICLAYKDLRIIEIPIQEALLKKPADWRCLEDVLQIIK